MKKSIRSIMFILVLLLCTAVWTNAATQGPIVGEVQFLTIDNPNDFYSGGTMVVGGQNVILPANLLIDQPANRLTLQQVFAQAPPACVAVGESGLAKGDTCNTLAHGASVSVLANITNGRDIIAGEVFMPKAGEVGLGAGESVQGFVTYIDYTDGYMRLNGLPGSKTTGVMVRINDPEGRHTVQQGLGCAAGNTENCSADIRYGLDPDNYTITFTTGYPACIPSTVTGIGNRIQGSDASGVGDAFCPDTNRTGNNIVPNSFLFAPIKMDDHIAAEGNFEIIDGVQFLSAHTLTVHQGLLTQINQPDYMTWDEVEWDVPGFQNQRVRMLMIGFTTLPGDNIDIFSLHIDPATNENHEFPLASTAGCEALGGIGSCLNQGLGGGAPNIFKVRYDVDFTATSNKLELYPCPVLEAGGFPGVCPGGATQDTFQNFSVLSPVSRELIGRSRNKQGAHNGGTPIVDSQDILGNAAPNGEYLTPVGIGHPEFVEINLNEVQTAFIFEGEPWNLDRRLGPGGCGNIPGDCDAPVPLEPFPYSGLNPATQAAGIPLGALNEITGFYPFGAGDLLPLSLAVDPPARGIVETPQVDLQICATGVTTPSTATAVTLASDVAAPQASGTLVTFTATAEPVIGTFEYRFWLKTGATWAIVQDFSTAADFPWDTTGLANGQYFIQVDVRGAGSTGAKDVSAVASYSISTAGAAAPATGVTLGSDLVSPQVAGTPIAFTAVGEGSTAYEYRFWLKTGATWAVVQPYSAAATWNWNPSGVAGPYFIQVDVRGAGTSVVRDAAAVVGYTLN